MLYALLFSQAPNYTVKGKVLLNGSLMQILLLRNIFIITDIKKTSFLVDDCSILPKKDHFAITLFEMANLRL